MARKQRATNTVKHLQEAKIATEQLSVRRKIFWELFMNCTPLNIIIMTIEDFLRQNRIPIIKES